MAHSTREAWLQAAIKALAPTFKRDAQIVLPSVKVSVGWPKGSRGGKGGMVIGQCFMSTAAGDAVNQLFISPVLDDAVRVLDVLAHELIHAAQDCKTGHKKAFADVATAIGLEGKPTATHAGPALRERLTAIAEKLGPYPHSALSSLDGPPKQTTRLVKVECTDCEGYCVRITRKWLDSLGAPICPSCETQMVEA